MSARRESDHCSALKVYNIFPKCGFQWNGWFQLQKAMQLRKFPERKNQVKISGRRVAAVRARKRPVSVAKMSWDT